jgi:hypothetical protein
MTKKLSFAKQWMLNHPNDKPCPKNDSGSWRRKREQLTALQAKYEAAMSEARAAKAAALYLQID